MAAVAEKSWLEGWIHSELWAITQGNISISTIIADQEKFLQPSLLYKL